MESIFSFIKIRVKCRKGEHSNFIVNKMKFKSFKIKGGHSLAAPAWLWVGSESKSEFLQDSADLRSQKKSFPTPQISPPLPRLQSPEPHIH